MQKRQIRGVRVCFHACWGTQHAIQRLLAAEGIICPYKGREMFLSEEAFSIYTEGLQTDVKKYIFVSILCFPCNHDPNRKVQDSWSCTQRTYRDRSIHLNTYLFKCQEASTLELFPSEYSQQNKQQAALQTGSKDDMWLNQSNQND